MAESPLAFLCDAGDTWQDRLSQSLTARERAEWTHDFRYYAHAGQLPPDGAWRTWLILAGRGFGKTRAGAEWVRSVAESDPAARIALVAASLGEARSVMVEGESGIMAVCPPDRAPRFEPSLRRLRFPGGAEAMLYSAAEPEALRGPQHSHAWCDEIAKWNNTHGRAKRTWDNLLLGLRLGPDQRVLATTTPRAVELVHRLLAQGDRTVVTRGTTFDNAGNLPPPFLQAMQREFGRTTLGRQELEGELLEDIEGALWTRSMIESCRASEPPDEFVRVVVGVDPPASARGDECGIVVAGLGDGVRSGFRLVKRYGGDDPQIRQITRPRPGTVTVSVNGDVALNWQLDAGGMIQFDLAPPPAAEVRAGYLFDIQVRFAEDRIDISGFNFAAGEAPSIPLIEVREPL